MMQRHKSRGSHVNSWSGSHRQSPRGGGTLGGPGLLGNVPRHGPMNQGGQGLLGGAPHDPFRHNANRDGPRRGPAVNPWEGGVVPGGGMAAMAQMRGGPGGGGLMPGPQMTTSHSSLLGNPQGFGPMPGGMSGAPGLLGGSPTQSPILGLCQMGNRDSAVGLNLMGNMMGGNMSSGGGPHFGPPPAKMRRLEQRIGSIGARPLRVGGGPPHHYHHHQHQSRPSGGGNLLPQDLRRRLKDKRLPFTPQSSSNIKQSSATPSSSSSSGAEKSTQNAASTTDTTQEKQASDTASSSADVVDTGSEDDSKPTESPEDLIPLEAIHCHICQLYKFSSKKAFLAHLSGSTHDEIARAFHHNNSAVLQLLRAQAKVAAQRQVIATRVAGEKVKLSQCFKCHCQVAGLLQKHITSVEHRLVNNFQILKCCNVWYSNRLDYEEHRITLAHQYREYLTKKKKEEAEAENGEKEEVAELKDEETEAPDVSWATNAALALQRMKKECMGHDPSTTATVTPYTGELSIGAEFLSCHGVVRCSVCVANVEVTQLAAHCRSSNHYYSVLKALKEREQEVSDESSPRPANDENDNPDTQDDAKEADADLSETVEGDADQGASAADDEVEVIEVKDNDDNGRAAVTAATETATEKTAVEEEQVVEEEDYDDALEEGDLMPELEFEDGDHPPNDEQPEEKLLHEEVENVEENSTDNVLEIPNLEKENLEKAVTEESSQLNEDQPESEEEIQECEVVVPDDEMVFEDEVIEEIPECVEKSHSAPSSGRGQCQPPTHLQQSLSPEGTPSRRSARASRKRGLDDATDEDEAEMQSPPRTEVAPKTPNRGRGRGRGRAARR